MSITDELREYADGIPDGYCKGVTGQFLLEIANRIDAEHERTGCIHYDPERHYCDVHDLTIDESMTEHGWVRLPVDADGEVWHPNDMMEAWGAVECMVLYPNGDWYLKGHDMSAPCLCASECRHHHELTVEDVLREMADRCYADEDEPRDRDAIVAEYAAKLQLRGDEE